MEHTRLGTLSKRGVDNSSRTEKNLFNDLPTSLPEELIENLFKTKDIRIERIVSTGHSSPPDFWYDQSETEWVILLRGAATLEFQNNQLVRMKPGDYVLIPAHKKHRVFSTSASKTTVWLAVFVHNDNPIDKE